MSKMSCLAPCYGVHEFLNLSDAIAVFGHGADYVLCSSRSLISHTVATGVSIVVKTVRANMSQPRWSPMNVARHIPDCLWPAVNESLVVNAAEALFNRFEVVWLMRGNGSAWFRGYSYESKDWEGSIIRWPEKPLPNHSGP